MSTSEELTTAPVSGPEAPAPDARRTRPGPALGDRAPWLTGLRRPLAYYVASRALVTAVMAIAAAASNQTFAQAVRRWDTWWFLRAAAHGYPTSLPHHVTPAARSTIAFFPVLPLLCRWLSDVTRLPLAASGLIISLTTGATATLVVWKLVSDYAGSARADRASLFFAFFPGTFAFNFVYTEGLAITLVAGGLLAIRRRRWLLAGVLGAVATATAPITLAFALSALAVSVVAIRRDRAWRSLLAPVLTPAGFAAFNLWLWRHTGNLDAWRIVERDGWDSTLSVRYPLHLVGRVLLHPLHNTITTDILVAGMAALVWGVVVAWRDRMPRPILAYGVAAGLLAVVSAPVGVRPRFVLDAFPLVLAIGAHYTGRSQKVLLACSVVGLAAFCAYEVVSWAVFP